VTRVISVRVPVDWTEVVTSERARQWVETWLQQPSQLFPSAPPGSGRLSLRLSNDEIALLKRLSGRATSSAVRAILAHNLSAASVKPAGSLKLLLGGVATLFIAFLFALAGLEAPKTQKS
jgi:hypothetical protein